jgi:hypothetical protein
LKGSNYRVESADGELAVLKVFAASAFIVAPLLLPLPLALSQPES